MAKRINTKHMSYRGLSSKGLYISFESVWACIVYLTVLVLLISGCARRIDRHDKRLDIGEDFASQYEAFEAASEISGRNVSIRDLIIRFDDENSMQYGEIGKCTLSFNSTPLIRIRRDYWLHASDLDRRELIFHEMGHCVLGLAHNDTLAPNGNGYLIPVSIMHTYHLGPSLYGTYSMAYDSQLFSQVPDGRMLSLINSSRLKIGQK